MKIGIIGTPGSGKTDLAQHIQESFPDHYILDRYVEALQQKIDVAAGVAGSHYINSAIAIERINFELARDNSFITCGTLIETMAYDAVYGLPVIDIVAERSRVQAMMNWFGMLFAETYLYDRLLFLPAKLEEWKQLDYQIRYAIKLFGLDPAEVDDVPEVIQSLKDYQKSLDEASQTDK